MNRSIVLALTLVWTSWAVGCKGDSHRQSPDPDPQTHEARSSSGVVATPSGKLRGTQSERGWAFLGIPYAAAPVGDARFAAPRPTESWEGIRDADSFGPKCPQIHRKRLTSSVVGDEDCLFLNVWSPELEPESPMPVLFFIHGGGNVIGSSSQTLGRSRNRFVYEGAHLAERGQAVVVTLNYRLGPLGFFTHPKLDEETDYDGSGNWGNLDQIAALEWVKNTIASFGGDPERVMVFGESAGAVNTCVLLTSPLARGLFSTALMQSAPCPSRTREQAHEQGLTAVGKTRCADVEDPVACMREMPFEDILDAVPGSVGFGLRKAANDSISWGPSVDGHVLNDLPHEVIRKGQHNAVPVVLGSNADEMASKPINPVTIRSELHYARLVERIFAPRFNDGVVRILGTYPAGDYEDANQAYVQLMTDVIFTCPTRRLARLLAQHQEEAIYRYFFTRRYETPRSNGQARHGIELAYLFGGLFQIPLFAPSDDDRDLAFALMDYWSSFAASGDPNKEGLEAWPRFDSETDDYLILDAPTRSARGIRTQKCDMWDALIEGVPNAE